MHKTVSTQPASTAGHDEVHDRCCVESQVHVVEQPPAEPLPHAVLGEQGAPALQPVGSDESAHSVWHTKTPFGPQLQLTAHEFEPAALAVAHPLLGWHAMPGPQPPPGGGSDPTDPELALPPLT
jgi:hypothetical protein